MRQVILIALLLTAISCTKAQKKELPGKEIIPGAKEIEVGFFTPFIEDGIINLVSNKGKMKIFRYVKKEMILGYYEGKEVITQILSYFDKNKKLTGIHTTHYDRETLQVLYWQYDNKSNHTSFAFKIEGTNIKTTQNLELPENNWQSEPIGLKLFQNESRELLFRGLNVPIGSVIKFPIIGMQTPFHGWVSYKYSKNKEVTYKGEKINAKIWESSSDPENFYVVIDLAPYVIKRVINLGKEKHVFSFGGS